MSFIHSMSYVPPNTHPSSWTPTNGCKSSPSSLNIVEWFSSGRFIYHSRICEYFTKDMFESWRWIVLEALENLDLEWNGFKGKWEKLTGSVTCNLLSIYSLHQSSIPSPSLITLPAHTTGERGGDVRGTTLYTSFYQVSAKNVKL